MCRDAGYSIEDALELATMEQLTEEIGSRFDTLAIVGRQKERSPDKLDKDLWRYKGDAMTAIGLLFNTMQMINQDFEDHEVHLLPPGEL